jgi:glycosyltransferase involved in cell wall biosynthesis
MTRAIGEITSRLGRSRTGAFLLGGLTSLYDGCFCTAEAIAKQVEQKLERECGVRFSVAIPHYNRGASIARPLRNLLNHPAVEEVVIVDDGSQEEQWQLALRQVGKIPHDKKIRMHRRKKNLGALRTKLECVERSSSKWVLILDSDNTAFQNYLNALASLEDPKKNTIYCASWAFPFFPFHELGEEAITFEKAGEFTRSGLLKRVYIINDGNYLVPRDEYVRNVSEIADARNHAADVMLVNYQWLSAGNRMQILPATSYFHRIEGSSFWENTKESSKAEALRLFAKFEAGQKWSPDF